VVSASPERQVKAVELSQADVGDQQREIEMVSRRRRASSNVDTGSTA
jgi:hypothetical protein